MIFSFIFLLKIGKLHFSDYLRNKAHSPTFNFAFCNLHEQTSNIHKNNQKFENFNLRGTSLLKNPWVGSTEVRNREYQWLHEMVTLSAQFKKKKVKNMLCSDGFINR